MTTYPTVRFDEADRAFREAIDRYHAHLAGATPTETAVLAMDRERAVASSGRRGSNPARPGRRRVRFQRWGLGCWLAALPAAATAGAVGLSGGAKLAAVAIGAALAGLALAGAVEQAARAQARLDEAAARLGRDGRAPGMDDGARSDTRLARRNARIALAVLLLAVSPLCAGGMACFGLGSPSALLAGTLSSLLPACFLMAAPFLACRPGDTERRGKPRDGGQEAARERVRLAAVRTAPRKVFEAERRARYREVKRAAQTWETERGFTVEERRHLVAELPRKRTAAAWQKAAAGVLLLIATYPASLTFAQALRLPFQYLPGEALIRVSWLGTAFWCALLAIAEVAIVRSLVALDAVRHARSVLEHGYGQEERWSGRPCTVLDRREAAARVRRPLVYLAGAAAVFGLELACNAGYLLWFADTAVWTRLVLPFAPTLAFLLLTFPLADSAAAIERLELAVARAGGPAKPGAPTGADGRQAGEVRRLRSADRMGPPSSRPEAIPG